MKNKVSKFDITNDKLKLKPKLSKSNNKIILDFNDILVSQVEYSEGPVGLTYIYFPKGAKVHMDIRGGWPAYLNSLSTNEKQHIDGINISGGSILGLESTTGIISEHLKKNNYEHWNGINGSIIYSQNLNENRIYPDKELGKFACQNLGKIIYNGQVGAGQSAQKGQGWYYYQIKGIKILGLVVNNAVGDIYKDSKKINTKSMNLSKIDLNKNTTITVLITNLKLDNDELKQMTHQVNCSMAETIKPFNTFFDGDVFYSCSTETYEKPKNFDNRKLIKFYMVCSDVIKRAILNSVEK